MPIINGPTDRTVKPMTPKQAAMLCDIIWERANGRDDSFAQSVRLLMEWDLLPWLYVNGSERSENIDQWIEFLEEWLTKLKAYGETCEKHEEEKPKPKSKKKSVEIVSVGQITLEPSILT